MTEDRALVANPHTPQVTSEAATHAFARLADIVAELREKCPWDRVQTTDTLRHLTIEETYELTDAILKNDFTEMKVELGDLMLHLIFYARIAEEQGKFSLVDVLTAQAEKLIRRHPHIYGNAKLDDAAAVRENWEKIKQKEHAKPKSVLSGVPNSMPSLIRAYRMQEKAANVGFDWPQPEGAWDKVKEEILEFEEAATAKDREAEMGDLLFSLVNYCRMTGINPDDALNRTALKFRTRFEYIEEKAREAGTTLPEMTLAEMDVFWDEAKAIAR